VVKRRVFGLDSEGCGRRIGSRRLGIPRVHKVLVGVRTMHFLGGNSEKNQDEGIGRTIGPLSPLLENQFPVDSSLKY
jgi:hypothetical protein